MKTSKYLIFLLSAALFLITAAPAAAQTLITGSENPVIVPMVPQRTVTFRAMMGKVKVAASVDYTVASDADWCKVEKTDGGFKFFVTQNSESAVRTATVTISNEENQITRTVKISQEAADLEKYVTTPDLAVTVKKSADPSGSSLSKTLDKNANTYYVKSATAGTYTQENPLNLDYTFSDAHIDNITYVPNDTTQGYMGKATISYKKTGSDEFTVIGTYNLLNDGKNTRIELPDGGLDNVATIRIAVWNGLVDGETEKLACAEMQFAKSLNSTDDYSVFADELLTTLRSGVTSEDIEGMSNPFAQDLASKIFNKEYDQSYRVAKYGCLPPASAVADTLLTGKYYDRFEGVTGIVINPGKFTVAVSGVPTGTTAQIIVTAYRPKGGNTGPDFNTYTIKNGMNQISYTADSTGLAYVVYNSNTPERFDSIGVHFINGIQNGYVTNKMTNDSIEKILKNAKYMCMDMLTDRMHLVFEGKSLLKYTAGRYRQLMNIYDTVMTWEHRLLGLDKYDRVPKNRMLFYVNYDYFMYDTWLGASAKNDYVTCLRPLYFLNRNLSTVWGVAHEIGHHQQNSYFTWGGMTEVSNNFFSSYVLLHIGEKTEDFLTDFAKGYQEYFVDDRFATYDSISECRTRAYKAAGNYSYSPKLKAAFEAMKDAKIPSRVADPLHAANFLEGDKSFFGNRLASNYLISYYFERERNNNDIFPDFFQDLRQTNRGTGKYELIASAQNKVSGRLAQLRKLYPNSVWVKNNYVHENCASNGNDAAYILNYIYKMSTATGYNMFPYFEQWGYLRQIATYTSDYGDHYYCLTEDMYNEFKEDMDARVASGELQEMSDELVKEIASYPIPFPNTFPVLQVPN